jgi:hypothetical protein
MLGFPCERRWLGTALGARTPRVSRACSRASTFGSHRQAMHARPCARARPRTRTQSHSYANAHARARTPLTQSHSYAHAHAPTRRRECHYLHTRTRTGTQRVRIIGNNGTKRNAPRLCRRSAAAPPRADCTSNLELHDPLRVAHRAALPAQHYRHYRHIMGSYFRHYRHYRHIMGSYFRHYRHYQHCRHYGILVILGIIGIIGIKGIVRVIGGAGARLPHRRPRTTGVGLCSRPLSHAASGACRRRSPRRRPADVQRELSGGGRSLRARRRPVVGVGPTARTRAFGHGPMRSRQ